MKAAELAFLKNPTQGLKLMPFDTQGTTEGAAQALAQAKAANVSLIIGPMTSAETRSLSETTVPVLSFSNDASVARTNIFVLGLLVEDQLSHIISRMQKGGVTRFAIVAPQGPYGDHICSLGRKLSAQRQLTSTPICLLIGSEDLQNPDFFASLKAQSPQSIIIAAQGKIATAITSLLAYKEMGGADISYYGLDGWRSQTQLWQDPHFQGSFFVGVGQERLDSFERLYHHTFGEAPHPIAGLSFDALRLVLSLVIQEKPLTAPSLCTSQGYLGAYGPFRLLPSGLNQRLLAVYTISSHKAVMTEPPAAGFENEMGKHHHVSP